MNKAMKRTFGCGHTVACRTYTMGAGNLCPVCKDVIKMLTWYLPGTEGLRIREIAQVLADWACDTPTHTPRRNASIEEKFAELYPEELPMILANRKSQYGYEWAERALSGAPKEKKPEKRHVQVAKIVKRTLTERYPGKKVSVHSDYNAVRAHVEGIDWEESRRAYRLLEQHVEGHFDGMTDSYDYDNRNDSVPQVSYLFIN